MTSLDNSPSLACILVSGPDAKKFLQGQLTCNLDEVVEGQAQLGAHCNPQGRVISLFQLFLIQNSYALEMPASLVPIALKALQKYAVFFKVTLQAATQTRSGNNAHWHLEAIQAGIPQIYPETSEKFLPHELNLPALHGVSFNKGCYTGQEIIARMQYRGNLKKHLHRGFVTIGTSFTPGSDIYRDHQGTLQASGYLIDSACDTEKTWVLILANDEEIATQPFYLDPSKSEPVQFINSHHEKD